MKKILITGANSYVGTSLEKWVENFPTSYLTTSISVRNDSWTEKDFSAYDVVLHVAGIAHIKETRENASLYYKVNRDLAYEVAQKAKAEGVKQFIFLSSMSVYGLETGVINEETPLKPKSNYGQSKLQAEDLINTLNDDFFKVAIIRPPMIYGKGCKGNYPRLAGIALKTPIFPYINNRRSMIYIDNLSAFIKILIDDCKSGLFLPQNNEYVNTSEMVRFIAEAHGKKLKLTRMFNPLLRMLKTSMVNKVFGDLIYDQTLSSYHTYEPISFEESIKFSEK